MPALQYCSAATDAAFDDPCTLLCQQRRDLHEERPVGSAPQVDWDSHQVLYSERQMPALVALLLCLLSRSLRQWPHGCMGGVRVAAKPQHKCCSAPSILLAVVLDHQLAAALV